MDIIIPKIQKGKTYLWKGRFREDGCTNCKDYDYTKYEPRIVTVLFDNDKRGKCRNCGSIVNRPEGYYSVTPSPFGDFCDAIVPYNELYQLPGVNYEEDLNSKKLAIQKEIENIHKDLACIDRVIEMVEEFYNVNRGEEDEEDGR